MQDIYIGYCETCKKVKSFIKSAIQVKKSEVNTYRCSTCGTEICPKTLAMRGKKPKYL